MNETCDLVTCRDINYAACKPTEVISHIQAVKDSNDEQDEVEQNMEERGEEPTVVEESNKVDSCALRHSSRIRDYGAL